MAKERPIQTLFDKILIVDFLAAIKENNKDLIGVTESEFHRMADAYMKGDKKKTPLEKRADQYYNRIHLAKACVFYLSQNVGDEEIMKILNDNNFKITKDNYFDDLKNIGKQLEIEQMKLDTTKSKLPRKDKKRSKNTENFNTFDVLTSVATGLELSLDFSNMVVNEFLSYRNQLQRKSDMMERTLKKTQKK